MDFLTMLLDPKFLSVVGPLGVIAVVEGYAIYKLFNLYSSTQEKRLEEWKQTNKDYEQLSQEINRTLDTVLKIIGNKRNGNGGNDCGQQK
jgi:hypothetical protein